MRAIFWVLVPAVCGSLMGQEAPILRDFRNQLDLMANQRNPAAVRKPETFEKAEEALSTASPEDVKALLPSARLCLKSDLEAVRLNGVAVFMGVAIRMDSADLLVDYIPDLGALTDGSGRIWSSAVFVLGVLHPRPPADVIPYLEPHLADEDNTDLGFEQLAGALLAVAPNNDRTVNEIITVARKRGGHAPGAAIEALMAEKTTNEAALQFVGEALNSSDPAGRNAAVCALGGRPDIMSRFVPRLRQIAADETEGRQTREVAAEDLKGLKQYQDSRIR
ncbi:MAG: hypothetical protein WCB12_22315 [Bryobacteraceae bacterium]